MVTPNRTLIVKIGKGYFYASLNFLFWHVSRQPIKIASIVDVAAVYLAHIGFKRRVFSKTFKMFSIVFFASAFKHFVYIWQPFITLFLLKDNSFHKHVHKRMWVRRTRRSMNIKLHIVICHAVTKDFGTIIKIK